MTLAAGYYVQNFAGNILKRMLGYGELQCIGATTLGEYGEYFEKDPALECCFIQVYANQPTEEDIDTILRGLRERYELHHGVRISDSTLVEAAILSHRYISGRFLPDKGSAIYHKSKDQMLFTLFSFSIKYHSRSVYWGHCSY